MSNIKEVVRHIMKWEGNYSDHPADIGGPTMKGITLSTFRSFYGQDRTVEDLKKITEEQWTNIFRKGYWDKMKGDSIKNTSLAKLIADMCWMSGTLTSLKKVQTALGLKADGIIGPKSLAALNNDPKKAFTTLYTMRKNWLTTISLKGQNKVFLKGWMNRLNDIKYIDNE